MIINHYDVVIAEMVEVECNEDEMKQRARFIDIAFCVVDPETGDEFYSLANTYSMNWL